MTDKALQQLVENISQQYFKRTFEHEAIFNSRLRTTGGRYMLESHRLEFNPKQLTEHGINALIDIIKHELCHYHLHLQGRGYKHGDQDFKELCQTTGAPRFCQPLSRHRDYQYIYQCNHCEQLYYRKRKINLIKYRCGICHSELHLTRKV